MKTIIKEKLNMSKITQNTLWLVFSEFIVRALKFMLIIIATRILGPEGYGKFSFALSFVALFGVVSDMGLSQIITREISQKQNRQNDFPTILSLKIVLSIIMSVIIVIYSLISVHDSDLLTSIYVLTIYMVSTTIGDFFYAYFQAKQKMKYESLAKIFQGIIVALTGILLIYIFKTPLSLSISYATGSALATIYILFKYKQEFKNNIIISYNQKIWKKYLIVSLPLAFTGIFVTIYSNIDSVMMGYYNQMVEVGLYNAAYRIIAILLIPSSILYKVYYPVISKEFIESKINIKNTFKNYMYFSLLIATVITFLGLLKTPVLLNIIYGHEYIDALFSLRILIIMAFVVYITLPFTQILIAAKMQKSIFYATFGGALINMLLNLILIPKYSLNGAAVSTLVAIVIVLLFQFFVCLKKKVII